MVRFLISIQITQLQYIPICPPTTPYVSFDLYRVDFETAAHHLALSLEGSQSRGIAFDALDSRKSALAVAATDLSLLEYDSSKRCGLSAFSHGRHARRVIESYAHHKLRRLVGRLQTVRSWSMD